MENWKRALVVGSIATGFILAISGRRTAGAAVAGVGLAVLATEYPDKLEQFWERAPEYIDRGTRAMATLSSVLERVAEHRAARQIESPYVV